MIAVTTVEPLDGYKLRLIFDDGSKRVVDLTDDLWGPMGDPLRDPAIFRQVRVDAELRTIGWPNGFDFDPDVLHDRSSQDVSLWRPSSRPNERAPGPPSGAPLPSRHAVAEVAEHLRPDVRRFGDEQGAPDFEARPCIGVGEGLRCDRPCATPSRRGWASSTALAT
jgi:Protein of unknown function (DUF2442)